MKRRHGFSMIDVVLATLIVGLLFVMSFQLASIGTSSTHDSVQLYNAIHLANNIHEFALAKPLIKGTTGSYTTTATNPTAFTNVSNLDGWSSPASGPIDSSGNTIGNMPGWSQSCQVKAFNSSSPSTFYGPTDNTNTTDVNFRKLTVTINFNSKVIYTCSWILAPTIQKTF